MEINFKNALREVLVHEGGWADHPKDPGGATMKGVTLMTYRRHFGPEKSKDDLRSISEAELEQIYAIGYWDKCKCNSLPMGVDYAVFDAAVNSGPRRAAKWLQAAVGANQDGSIGANTLSKVDTFESITVSDNICDQRLTFLRSLSTWATFGRGWERRVEGVRKTAKKQAEPAETTTPSIDFDIIRLHSSGDWVKKLQHALGITVDGQFGNNTDSALRKWQQEHGLEADGVAGRMTYRVLGLIE